MPEKNRRRSPFGIWVKTELIQLGKTNRELSAKIGLAESTLCDVIAGRNTCDRTIEKIRKTLEQWREDES